MFCCSCANGCRVTFSNVNSQTPKTRAQVLAEDIERTIAQQGLRHGDSLGTLDSWRDQTGFARSTVSEAVRLMIDRGAVEIRPGRGGGIFVAATSPVVRLRHTLLTIHGEPSTVADAIAIREALEPLIDADAARHRTKDDIADLRKHLKSLSAASSDTDRFMRANWALHARIARITKNQMLKAVYTSMTEVIAEMSAHADSDSADAGSTDSAYLQERERVHTELVEAIIAGDVERVGEAVLRHAL
jgi:GntR family transcriptional regulator, transcriptional repressor for pyruvate dehydrogenase complex